MKTYNEMAQDVFRIGDKRKKQVSNRRKKTAVTFSLSAVVIATVIVAGKINPAKAPQTQHSVLNTLVSAQEFTQAKEEQPEKVSQMSESSGALKNNSDSQETIVEKTSEKRTEEATTKKKSEPKTEQTTNPKTDVTVGNSEGTQTDSGAASYDSYSFEHLIKNDEIGWLKYEGRRYVRDRFAGTYVNGIKIEPDKFLGYTTDFEGQYKNKEIKGKVYSLNVVDISEELMIAFDDGKTEFLLVLPDR